MLLRLSTPFDASEDILKPNEAYWADVDFVVEASKQRGLFVAMAPLWIRWGGNDKEGWRNHLTDANAGPYGEFLGKRYTRFNNLMWILGGDANPKEKTEAIRAIAHAIKKHAPHQLITVHNAPENASAVFFGEDAWLDVNLAYTYREVPGQVLAEWQRPGQPRPLILGESGYEEENNDRRGGDAFRMRRQFYGAILSGALGGHAFGQKHVWRFDEQWREALDTPATKHMVHAGKIFMDRSWWLLTPDLNQQFVIEGRGQPGTTSFMPAALASDGSCGLVYVPESLRSFVLELSSFRAAIKARWFDPTSGKFGDEQVLPAPTKRHSFKSPGKNAAGDGDWVLVLEADAEFK